MTKGNKLKTPQSAQSGNKKRPLNQHSDPPKKKKFQNSDDDDSDIDDFDFDKELKKKLLSDAKASPMFGQGKKRNRDDDDEDDSDEFLEIDSDDDLNDDSDLELEPINMDDKPRGGKRNKLSMEDKNINLKKNTDNKSEPIVSCVDEVELKKDIEIKANRDKKTLILRNINEETTVDDVNSLCKEIIAVRMINCKGKNTKGKKCVFIEFADEAAAEKNKKYLTGKKLNGVEITIDYVGEKSSLNSGKTKAILPQLVDSKVLHVSGLRPTMTEKELYKYFPGCDKIDLAVSRKDQSRKDFAFVRFSDAAKCSESHKLGQHLVIDGQKVLVQFARTANRIQRIREKKQQRELKRKLMQGNDPTKPKPKKASTPTSNIQAKKNQAKSKNQGLAKAAIANQQKKPNVNKAQEKKVTEQKKMAKPIDKKNTKAISPKNKNPGLTSLKPPSVGLKGDNSVKKKKVPTATLR